MSLERSKTHISSFNELNGLVIDQDKEFFDLLNIHIKSLEEREPIEIDFNQELHNFLHANLLKPFESQSMKMKYLNVILEPRIQKMLKFCFWHILCNRFPETVDVLVQEQIQQYYKRKLSRNYVKLFQCLPQPKDELVNYVIFTISYLIHFCFYKYFPPQREFFDFRFILNCYHTVLFEFNGIFVSDIYVKMHIEKYFTHKFLDYEKKNIKELLQRKLELKKLNNKKFLGFSLEFPDITGTRDGQDFRDKVMTRLKKDKNKLSLPTIESESLNDRWNNRSKMQSSAVDSSSIQSMSKSKSHTESDVTQNNLRINCNQVSPTLGKLLQYEDLNLPFKKKKFIKHVFEKVNSNENDLLNQMKLMQQEKEVAAQKKKEIKLNQKGKTLIDHYNLRPPPKEYYQKHQGLDKYFKDMLDVNYVLTENCDQMSNLPSSIEILNQYNNKLVGKMQTQIDEKILEEKLIDQKKQIKQIDQQKKDSGNQDIFDLPYDGSRSQGRKLLAYVHQKCRRQLEEQDQNMKYLKDMEKLEQYSNLNRVKSEGLLLKTQFTTLPSINPVKTLMTSRDLRPDLVISEADMTRKSQPPQLFNFNALTPSGKDLTVSQYLSPKQQQISNLLFDNDTQSKQITNIRKSIHHDSEISQLNSDKLQKALLEDKSENHRKIKSRIISKDENIKPNNQANLPEFILNRALDPGIIYEDKRQEYKQKYNQIFEKISVDQNIDDLCHNILQKRNLFSHGLKKKLHR